MYGCLAGAAGFIGALIMLEGLSLDLDTGGLLVRFMGFIGVLSWTGSLFLDFIGAPGAVCAVEVEYIGKVDFVGVRGLASFALLFCFPKKSGWLLLYLLDATTFSIRVACGNSQILPCTRIFVPFLYCQNVNWPFGTGTILWTYSSIFCR